MKKAIFVGTSTVVGVVGVLSYTPPAPNLDALATSPVNTPIPAETSAPAAPATNQSSGVSGTFDGSTSQTRYGPIQVRIVVENGKITKASALQYPTGENRSVWINQQAVPWLVNQTLKAQSASLDGVGGATYTTEGWISSLANALSKAGL